MQVEAHTGKPAEALRGMSVAAFADDELPALLLALRSALPGEPAGRAVPDKEYTAYRDKDRRMRVHRARNVRYHKVTLRQRGTEERLVVDTHQARLRRCQKRVHAWAKALPWKKRRARRRGKVINTSPTLKMLTLTYRPDRDWMPNDIRDFMKTVRKHLGNKLLGYAWVLEMQERGAAHYHVLLYVQRGTKVPEPDTAGWWAHGMTRIETARSPFYIVKYTGGGHQKEYQKEGLPKGARMFAVWLNEEAITELSHFRFRLSAVPAWLRPHLKKAAQQKGYEIRWKRNPGGGWIICDTEEVFYSEWVLEEIEAVEPGISLAELDE